MAIQAGKRGQEVLWLNQTSGPITLWQKTNVRFLSLSYITKNYFQVFCFSISSSSLTRTHKLFYLYHSGGLVPASV